MSGLWGWMKKAKQNGGRKGYLSRGRFLSRNREPRSSQSLWFIITLGIHTPVWLFVIYRFKDYLFIWAWNDVVAFATNAVFLLFLVVLHGLYTTQHKCNVNYKKGRGAPQNRDHLRKGVLFKRRFTYIFIGSGLFISTRAYFKYGCFKRPGRLKWWPCFGRAVNDRHGFFQVRRPRSPICKVCLSFSQRIFDFQIE